MDLYPSQQPQAYEMLWCAGQCGNLNGSSSGGSSSGSSPDVISQPYLTFADYSVFASEMKRAYTATDSVTAPAPKIPHKNTSNELLPSASEFITNCNSDKSSLQCQVFLGGACNPTTWRKDAAVPILKDLGITFFNPQVTNWEPGLIELEHQALENADVLFYVLDNQTRGVVVMIEVAYFVSKQRNIVLVINGFKEPGQRISNEPISQIEYEDLTCGQMILQDLVEHHGIPVFNDIPAALNCTAKIVRDKIKPKDVKLADIVQPMKKGVVQVGNKLINLQQTFENLDSKRTGEISLSNVRTAYRILTNGELTKKDVCNVLDGIKRLSDSCKTSQSPSESESQGKNGLNGPTLNFDQFCYIMSELIFQHYRNSAKNLSNMLSNKANYFTQSISQALNRLLEHVPGNKPGWMPLLSENESTINPTAYDVYLGGDCSPDDNWRLNTIQTLRNQDLSYFNPQNNNQSKSKHISLDKSSIDRCRVILFNLSSSTRSIEFMTMAAYYFGLGRQVVLCIRYLQDECQINGEKLSKVAIKDYNRGRSYLSEMAKRDGVPIFEDINQAVDCVIDMCKNSKSL